MDYVEILSDCSESSKDSECLSTNTSVVSGFSDYQGEFLELKQLIDPDKVSKASKINCVRKNNNIKSWYEEHIQTVNTQLQNSFKQNEKYKNDIYNLEKKKILLNENIEKILRRTNQLEGSLGAANNQIERLINIYNAKDDQNEVTLLGNKILHLEKCNHDLNIHNSLLSNEINYSNYQKNEVEADNKNLKIEINELKLELAAKLNCVTELKAKISEQHVKHQKVLQSNVKISHSLNSVSNELQYVKRSENWYKEELHRLQKEKIDLTQEMVENKKIIALQGTELEHLKLELNKLKYTYEEMSLTALKEKECLLKQAVTVNNQVVKIESENVNFCKTCVDIERIADHYEKTIRDLINDVARIKLDFEIQQNTFEKVTKEHSEVLAKYLLLQNCLKKKEYELEKLEYDKKDLKMKLSATMDKEIDFNTKILCLKNVCSGLEVELSVRNQEKENIEESVKIIKEQFKIFKNKYDSVNNELHIKNREMLQLQFDKQELYMNNNWKTCELQKTKEKDVEIGKLQKKLTELIKNGNDLKFENCKQLNEIESLHQKETDLQRRLDEHETIFLETVNKYEKTLSESKSDVNKLTALLQEKENIILNLKDNFNILKEEFHSNDEKLEKDILNLENKKLFKSKELFSDTNLLQENVTNFVVNNYANFKSVDNVNVVDILEYICKLCKVKNDYVNISTQYCNITASDKSEYINILLKKIDSYFQLIDSENTTKQDVISTLEKKNKKLQKYTIIRIESLNNRCKKLEEKNEESLSILMELLNQGKDKSSDQNEVKHLQALLQVKMREQKDKQRRYETNNRTLLRKVKEHMKGRNVAERHNVYLQELYNSLSDEYNSLRLQIDIKDSEINKLQNNMEVYINNNEKMKLSMVEREKQLSKSNQCESCIELKLTRIRERKLDESLQNCENSKIVYQNELRQKVELVDALKKENQELMFKISNVNNENSVNIDKINVSKEKCKQLSDKLNDLENVLSQEKSITENLKTELLQEKENYLQIHTERSDLKRVIENITEKNWYLLKEVEHINSRLQQKCEELKELQIQKVQNEDNWLQKNTNMQNLITSLKSQLQIFKIEIDTIKSEKFFLQRLCNDLKIALQIHVNQNKVLKEHVNNLCREKDEFSSLPIILSNFPSPKYNDVYINTLLKENKAPLEDKPLSDIQEGLDTLRKEIFVLQKQIVEKNFSNN